MRQGWVHGSDAGVKTLKGLEWGKDLNAGVGCL